MSDTRHKNVGWNLPERTSTYDQAQLAVLMDIRDELQELNALFRCHNFLQIPAVLRDIRRNTCRKKKKVPASKTPAS